MTSPTRASFVSQPCHLLHVITFLLSSVVGLVAAIFAYTNNKHVTAPSRVCQTLACLLAVIVFFQKMTASYYTLWGYWLQRSSWVPYKQTVTLLFLIPLFTTAAVISSDHSMKRSGHDLYFISFALASIGFSVISLVTFIIHKQRDDAAHDEGDGEPNEVDTTVSTPRPLRNRAYLPEDYICQLRSDTSRRCLHCRDMHNTPFWRRHDPGWLTCALRCLNTNYHRRDFRGGYGTSAAHRDPSMQTSAPGGSGASDGPIFAGIYTPTSAEPVSQGYQNPNYILNLPPYAATVNPGGDTNPPKYSEIDEVTQDSTQASMLLQEDAPEHQSLPSTPPPEYVLSLDPNSPSVGY